MNSITPNDVCNLLNQALIMDPECINNLFSYRIQCNNDITNHPSIQIQQFIDDNYPKLGFLGLINGMFNIENNKGTICMEINTNGKILKFKTTPQKETLNDIPKICPSCTGTLKYYFHRFWGWIFGSCYKCTFCGRKWTTSTGLK